MNEYLFFPDAPNTPVLVDEILELLRHPESTVALSFNDPPSECWYIRRYSGNILGWFKHKPTPEQLMWQLILPQT
jgi:hypothetical protein